MKNRNVILLAGVAVMGLTAPAFAADPETFQKTTTIQKDASGNYIEKDQTTKTDAAGTTTTFDKEAKVNVDANGNIEKSTTTEKVVDPSGVADSHVVQTSNQQKIQNGQVTTRQDVVVDGKVVDSKMETKAQ